MIVLICIVGGALYSILNNGNFTGEVTPDESVMNDEQWAKKVFQARLDAMENCDIELANSLVTEKPKEILHSTCENMENERKCYAGRETFVRAKSSTAVLCFEVYSHEEGWPFFFKKEGGEWKIDFYKMANSIAMIGGGRDTGWSWRDEGTKRDFCGLFPEGRVP